MALKNQRSQAAILENAKIALQNVETNPTIKSLMESLGYNAAKMAEGNTVLQTAKSSYDENQLLDDNKAKTSKAFEDKRIALNVNFVRDRKKARVILSDDTLVLKELGVAGGIPKTYVKWLENINQFYNTLKNQPELAAKLTSVQITPEYIIESLAGIAELESLRAARTQNEGITQNATKIKDKAFKDLDKWMGSFFAIARIALENEPQLLESLGKFVRS